MTDLYHPQPDPYETLLIRRDGAIDWLTLNRPEALNALSIRMQLELQHYFETLYRQWDTRVVILRGAGRAYCAGLDIKEVDLSKDIANPVLGLRVQQRVADIIKLMRKVPQPIISLINGAASGGGMALALASDVRIATPTARFNAAFIRLGVTSCDVGTSYFLPRLVGCSVASEMMLTGRFIDASRAERTGLVSAVVSEEELDAAGRAMAEDMLRASPLGLRLTKDGINQNLNAPSLDAAMALEDRQQILCGHTEDVKEAFHAFVEKRAPTYKDR